MFCENCGKELLEGAKFCGSCGAKTGPEQPAPTVAAEPPPVHPVSPPPAYTPPVQTAPPRPQGYAPAQPRSYPGQPASEPLSVGQYIGMFLLLCVPLLNIILLFVWSFGGSVNLNRKNFARASLIISAVMVLLWIVAGGLIGGILSEISGGFY